VNAKINSVPKRLTVGTALFLVSWALIALQLFLMRSLAVGKSYHFSYLVISTALLGFGGSGTLLSLRYSSMARDPVRSLKLLLFLFSLSIPLSYLLTRLLPVDIRYLFYQVSQGLYVLLYILLLALPFFFGALFIGFCLSYFREKVPLLYGLNLFGSGLGGLGALGVMYLIPPMHLPLAAVAVALTAQLLFLFTNHGENRGRHFALVLLVLAAVVSVFLLPSRFGRDPYKTLSHLERLEVQGEAERLLSHYDPQRRLDVYRAPSLHHTLFAGSLNPGGEQLPPEQLSILYDGEPVAALFRIRNPQQAEILDSTPQSLLYRLIGATHDSYRALLPGEIGGTGIWLARRFGADSVTVVQESRSLLELYAGPLYEQGGESFFYQTVHTRVQIPRFYIKKTNERYELIHLVSAEGMPGGTEGLQSLNEDFLLTREGIAESLARLTSRGLLGISRGIQSPPRDNIKIFALFLEALEEFGAADPSRHILQARNYLAATSIISPSPIDAETIDLFKKEAAQLGMDLEYYPGIRSDELVQRNRIEGPPEEDYSYLHQAARMLTEGGGEEFFRSYLYNVRPPSDGKPYFFNFFKWKSLPDFIHFYGTDFLRYLDLGYLVLILSLMLIVVAAFVLILLPLGSWRRRGLHMEQRGYRLPVFLHFASIGLGFMLLEMLMIRRLVLFLGDPIYSTSAVITAILVCAGLGSTMQSRFTLSPIHRIRIAASMVILSIVLFVLFLDPLLDNLIGWSLPLRYLSALALLAPSAFFMGWMLPSGMGIVAERSPELMPWAWGINGFFSVAAGPLSVLLAMELGFRWVFAGAAAAYALAGICTLLWPKGGIEQPIETTGGPSV